VVVEGNVSARLPDVGFAPPSGLALRWHASLGAGVLDSVSGRYALVQRPDGVQVWDAVTGALRWHYLRRADRFSLVEAPLTGDGGTVVAIFRQSDRPDSAPHTLVIGLDLATGQALWQWTAPINPGDLPPSTRSPGSADTGRWYVVGDQLVDVSVLPVPTYVLRATRQEARGFDLRTGAPRWTRSTSAGCAQDPVESLSGAVFAVSLACGPVQLDDQVRGYSATDGRPLWTWAAPRGYLPAVDGAVASTFLIKLSSLSDGRTVRLDTRTGQARGTVDAAGRWGADPVVVLNTLPPYQLSGLDPVTSAVRWSRPLPGGTAVARLSVAVYPAEAYTATTGSAADTVTVSPIVLDTGRVSRAYQFHGDGAVRFLSPGPGVLVLQTSRYPDDNDLYGIG
jgi:hypothetical protein